MGAGVELETMEGVVWFAGAARNSPKGSDASDTAVLLIVTVSGKMASHKFSLLYAKNIAQLFQKYFNEFYKLSV